ncbi:UDP-glucose/GDP-mannose dehydrogenase family protein [Leptolyngbyaceae cyanobacterium CCMR0082]|uniref:UDP-glucose 6-dehydrogenase n=2 Tax=Adonisia turfae TaxID=2950184 RepID=A0A6M0SEL1_9CYAN|nr:UDP-glucose/GDP-mannose dehydrogenase family protein [Adonisia turfae]NEZ60287.1 UDP-glucose/GDP-mannose dehydrogenase family protein [Adonisia turfae CCMR0081]NEZ66102.1 UDP-glucose/GDP-mannose dehydrogenase family protein [Adonisia turfae CCMR0082]
MRVSVIGTGYVGLVTGACLAHIGHEVVCVDNNAEKVAMLQAGQSPIYEPGLTDIMDSEQLSFTTDLAAGVSHGEVIFIAVGTPPLPTGESDTRYVEAVARGIGQHIGNDYKVIVNKSTVPVGSGDWVCRLILDELEDRDAQANFEVVSNPEFLREGSAVYDTFNPDRIVLGGHSPKAIERMRQLYAPIIHRQFAVDTTLPAVPVVVTDLASAETIKYAANAFLATKISFINEIANICDRIGADVTQVAQGIGLDSRIGGKFLQAGIGWGGSCFPKDVSALMHIAQDYGVDTTLLDATIATNRRQRLQVVYQLQKTLKILKGKTIGLLGLTFKPNTDDLRDAPALDIIVELKRLGAKVKAYDPIIEDISAPVILVDTPTTLAYNCDALVLVTDWNEFQHLDYSDLARRMKHPILIDGRNCLNPQQLQQSGFYYQAIGRPSAGQLLWPTVRHSVLAA